MNNIQECTKMKYRDGGDIFENKSGIPIAPYKECMIDGSESPNARGSF